MFCNSCFRFFGEPSIFFIGVLLNIYIVLFLVFKKGQHQFPWNPIFLSDIYKFTQQYEEFYNALILNGQLWDHLAQLNEQVQDRLDSTIHKMAAAEAVTEDLKAADPLARVGAMNNIRSRAEEIVLQELIWEEETI